MLTGDANFSIGKEGRLGCRQLGTHILKGVSNVAKEIVKKWKHAVEKEKQALGSAVKTPTNGKITELGKKIRVLRLK